MRRGGGWGRAPPRGSSGLPGAVSPDDSRNEGGVRGSLEPSTPPALKAAKEKPWTGVGLFAFALHQRDSGSMLSR